MKLTPGPRSAALRISFALVVPLLIVSPSRGADRLPPPGIAIPESEREQLTAGAATLRKDIDALAKEVASKPKLLTLLPEEHFGLLVVSHLEGSGLRFKLKQAILDKYFPDKRAPRVGLPRPKKELDAYAGTYLANNYCRTCADGANEAQRFEIVANDDGSLGLWDDKWRQVEPLLFSSLDGKRRIGFMRDSAGTVMAVSAGSWRVLERKGH